MKIFIDAGHNFSGFNTGAVANGMREQDITFSVSAHLVRLLAQEGVTVKLSRPTLETNLGHDNASAVNIRPQMANDWGADYFISIHVNAGGGTGAETLFGREDSRKFAQTMQDIYSAEMGLRNRRIWLREDIAVVRQTKMPAILLETAFIDAPTGSVDLEVLRDGHLEMAEAIAKGIFEYVGIKPTMQPKTIAPNRLNTLEEMPDWAKPTIKKLVGKGFLAGTDQGLDLSLDMVRIFVIHDRAGLYN